MKMKERILTKTEREAELFLLDFQLCGYGTPNCYFKNSPIIGEALNKRYFNVYHHNHPNYDRYHQKICLDLLGRLDAELQANLENKEKSFMIQKRIEEVNDVLRQYIETEVQEIGQTHERKGK